MSDPEEPDNRNIPCLIILITAVLLTWMLVLDCKRRAVDRIDRQEQVKTVYAEDRMNVMALETFSAESPGHADGAGAVVVITQLNRFAGDFEKKFRPGPMAKAAWARAHGVFLAKKMITPYEKQTTIMAEDISEVEEAYRDMDWLLKTAMERGFEFNF
ncbi:MAG: hypothetical protein LLG37_03020 [Spirochaetia bacterium]|nr:hypothetical protein [Spirochaetia bacterium]